VAVAAAVPFWRFYPILSAPQKWPGEDTFLYWPIFFLPLIPSDFLDHSFFFFLQRGPFFFLSLTVRGSARSVFKRHFFSPAPSRFFSEREGMALFVFHAFIFGSSSRAPGFFHGFFFRTGRGQSVDLPITSFLLSIYWSTDYD